MQKLQESSTLTAIRELQTSSAVTAALKMETTGAFSALRELQSKLDAMDLSVGDAKTALEVWLRMIFP